MEKKRSKKDIALLPRYFKVIGLAVIILSIVPIVVIKSLSIKMLQVQKELWVQISANTFILGLLFIAWSKDKIEDEMTFSIRLKAMAFAFICAVFSMFISPFVDLLFKSPIENETGHQVVVVMLFVYLMSYYFQKRNR